MELWSPEHIKTLLPALGVMLIISAFLRLVLGKKSLKVRMIPIQIIACLLLLLEVGKQVVSWKQGYDLYHLPFHFCSLFIFMLPLMAFYRGKYEGTVRAITSAITTSMFLLLMIYPCLIYGAGNIEQFFTGYLDFHTVAFHNIVVFEFILIIALQLHEPQPKGEIKAILLFTTGFCVISATMAQLLETNFANYYQCNIPPLEQLRLSIQASLGYWPTQLLYIAIVSGLTLAFVYGSYWFYRLMRNLTTKKFLSSSA
jgi:hypothetical protein